MTESEESAYEQGRRSVLTQQLAALLRDLGYDDLTGYVLERERAIAVLRQVCAEHGDNNWDEHLFLPDIIEKHLWDHLEDKRA